MQGCPSSLIGNGPVTLSEGLSLLVGEHVPLREQLEVLFSLCTKVETEEEKRVALDRACKGSREFFNKS